MSTPTTARELAYHYLNLHGLRDWSFAFNRSKRNLGRCLFDPKLIELSHHFVERNSLAVIRDTLLHEIAHALVGPGHGHDDVWKAMCKKVGAIPERLSLDADMPEGRWQATCASCGMQHHKHRRPKFMHGWYCCRCGRVRGKLLWVDIVSLRNGHDMLTASRRMAGKSTATP